MRILILF